MKKIEEVDMIKIKVGDLIIYFDEDNKLKVMDDRVVKAMLGKYRFSMGEKLLNKLKSKKFYRIFDSKTGVNKK
jgi:hypothetical protein